MATFGKSPLYSALKRSSEPWTFPFKLLTAHPGALGRQFLSLSELFALASSKKIIWFGEFHSEERISSLLEQLVMNLFPMMEKDFILCVSTFRLK